MKKFFKLLVLVLWMGVIFYMSQRSGRESSEMSNGLLFTIAEILRIKDIPSFIMKYGYFIRKLAHFSEYLILGILVYINVIEYVENKKTIFVSLFICISYAVSDELHQGLVDGRSPALFDVFIDSCGSFTGIVFSFLTKKICYHVKKH